MNQSHPQLRIHTIWAKKVSKSLYQVIRNPRNEISKEEKYTIHHSTQHERKERKKKKTRRDLWTKTVEPTHSHQKSNQIKLRNQRSTSGLHKNRNHNNQHQNLISSTIQKAKTYTQIPPIVLRIIEFTEMKNKYLRLPQDRMRIRMYVRKSERSRLYEWGLTVL